MTEAARSKIEGRIDGLSTAYATLLNTGKRRALKSIDDEIKSLRVMLEERP